MYKEYLKRKEKIIINAIELLDEVGIQGLTTRELAKREGITEPAIYRQFESKKGIILAILDRFAEYDDVIRNTIIEQNMTPRKAIYFYADSYSMYYQNYPQITTVMFSPDLFKYEEDTNHKMTVILESRHNFISELVKKGQECGDFDNSIECSDLADIINGIIWYKTNRWKTNNVNEDLKSQIQNALKWILNKEII